MAQVTQSQIALPARVGVDEYETRVAALQSSATLVLGVQQPANFGSASLYGRIYDPVLQASSQVRISTETSGVTSISSVDAAALPGGYVVAWQQFSQGTAVPNTTRVKVFDLAGNQVGQEQIITGDGLGARNSKVESFGDGSFVVGWTAGVTGQTTGYYSQARLQLFSPAGAKVGSEIVIADPNQTIRLEEIVTLADGSFLVVWHAGNYSDGTNASGAGESFGQRFSATGQALSAQFSFGARSQNVEVAALDGGGFAAVWTQVLDNAAFSVRGRAFSASGTPLNAASEYASQVGSPSYLTIAGYEIVGAPGDQYRIVTSTALGGNLFTGPPDNTPYESRVFSSGVGIATTLDLTLRGRVFDVARTQDGRITYAADLSTVGTGRLSRIGVLDDRGAVITGTAGEDVIAGADVGAYANNVIAGGAGPDALFGLGGADRLSGEAGADTLVGGLGLDTLTGGSDSDLLYGGTGRDPIRAPGTGPSNSFAFAGSWTGAGNGTQGWYAGDFNGDGRTDLVRYQPGVAGAELFVSNGTSFQYGGILTTADNAGRWYVGDFDGDGTDDLRDGTLGNDFGGSGDQGWYIGDFNGDGRDDLLRYKSGVSGAEVLLSNGRGQFGTGQTVESWTPAGNAGKWYVGDFNGDGRSDIATVSGNGSGLEVLISTGTSFAAPVLWTGFDAGPGGWYVGDFNGDGRSDVARYVPGSSGAQVLLSTGASFQDSGSWTGAGVGSAGWVLGNFDGLGGTDLLRYVPGVSGGEVFLSQASPDSRDVFVFEGGFGKDTIVDFDATTANHDIIQFGAGLFGNYDTMIREAYQFGSDVLIVANPNDVLTLKNVTLASLTPDDFLFA